MTIGSFSDSLIFTRQLGKLIDGLNDKEGVTAIADLVNQAVDDGLTIETYWLAGWLTDRTSDNYLDNHGRQSLSDMGMV